MRVEARRVCVCVREREGGREREKEKGGERFCVVPMHLDAHNPADRNL